MLGLTPKQIESVEPIRIRELKEFLQIKVRQALDDRAEGAEADISAAVNALDILEKEAPDVFNHNTETIPRLYKKVRGRADYQRTLDLLARVKAKAPDMRTKSGLMLGLGETTAELFDVFADLRAVGCDVLTLGQYLAPTLKHIPVARFVPPAEFDELAGLARTLGFKQVVAGPFVRSSYHADEMVPA